ncbi:progestin and adipoQ receptor family member 3 [Diorhabda carinulata]|uniref:progestin and adipoQ receptor family member 3 n=1 Tax=Diorhabda carinulata TaxID=1163345 RepID=UPI0025A126B4|nr:progestin and adipoQ receptor family member 3 [Diorhabda carinulata]XP_057662885.1 progestin and adipoQ receptor family member 3 [Diorhabda carinulata]
MTVTLVAKHEVVTDDNDNETCCTTSKAVSHDRTQSLLEDLSGAPNKNSIDEESDDDEYDEIFYQKAKELLPYDQAPPYLKHNPFILTGYRKNLNTDLCVSSIFWWTNETINIWSHIFGLFLFILLPIYDFMILKIQATFSDKIIVGSFLACFVLCMALSALYHTFSCRSEKDCNKYLSYDLFGIALSLLAIYTSGIYYAFWCDTDLQLFYTSTVTVIFAIAMTLHIPHFNIHSNIKTIVFVAWGLYGVIPTIHWTIINGGFENPLVCILLPRVIGMYIISGIAFVIYITKIPERFLAGKFDFVGHSHQWWHIFVVLALYYWHNSGLIYIEYRLNHACPNKMKFP